MGIQISWQTFMAQMGHPLTPAIASDQAQAVYWTNSPAAFEELTASPPGQPPPLWRVAGRNDDITNGKDPSPTAPSLEQTVREQLVRIYQQTSGITDPRVNNMVEKLIPHDMSSSDAPNILGIMVDSAFDQDASRDLRSGAQLALYTLLETSDLARAFWRAACFRVLGGTISDEKATADDEAMRGIYGMLLDHIMDNPLDSPLHFAAKTFLTFIRASSEHILPSACKEKATQIRASFAHYGPSDMADLINGLWEISTKYRTVMSWLYQDSEEVADEIDELIGMLREGNAAQTLFAMSALPLVIQGGLSPDSPRLAEVANSLHHIMLFGTQTYNYESAMATFAQIKDFLPRERVEYVENNLGTQRFAYKEILDRVLRGQKK